MESTLIVDQTYAALTDDVLAAEAALVEVAKEAPDQWWYPYDLRQRARNGWSPGAMGIALDNLIARHTFEVSADQRVRLRG
jgi:hypothetical protein